MPETFVITSPDGSVAEATVFADEAALIAGAVDFIAASAAEAIAARGSFAVALSGGNTPKPVYQRLVTAGIDWTRVHVFFSDERCVPPQDTRSNCHMARAALLDHVAIPAGNVHRMRGEDPPEAAAEAYAADLRNALGDDGRLDLVLLGLGQDAHTASLFPGMAAVTETRRTVMASYVEYVGMWRLTLTPPAINAARRVAFLVSGADKAGILHRVLHGPRQPVVLVVASSGAGRSLMKDSAPPDHMQVGSTEVGINAKESTPKMSAAIDAQQPAEGLIEVTRMLASVHYRANKELFDLWQTGPMKPITKYGGLPSPERLGQARPDAKRENIDQFDISERNAKAAYGGGYDGWHQGRLIKIVGHQDQLVGDAQCQQKVSKKNRCNEQDGHSGGNGRRSETAALSGAAREDGKFSHRSGGHRSSCCRANYADHIRRAVRRSIDASVCLSDALAGRAYPTCQRSKCRSKVIASSASWHDREPVGRDPERRNWTGERALPGDT